MGIVVPESELEVRRARKLAIMTIGALRAKGYMEVNYPGLGGKCIVVPAGDFDVDWKLDLARSGHACACDVIDDLQVVLVRVTVDPELMRSSSRAVVSAAAAVVPVSASVQGHVVTKCMEKSKGGFMGSRWSSEEVERLLKRWPEVSGCVEVRAASLVSEFKGRSAKAIELKYRKLLAKKPEFKKTNESEKSMDQVVVGVSASKAIDFAAKEDSVARILNLIENLQVQVNTLRNDLDEVSDDLQGNWEKIGDSQRLNGELKDRVDTLENEIKTLTAENEVNDVYDKNTREIIADLKRHLVKHKHVVSGEAVLSLEACK